MGALTTTESKKTFVGDGSSVALNYPFLFYADEDLKVYLDDTTSTDAPVLLVDPTHYSVAGAGDDAGGVVTMVTAAIVGENVIVDREPDETQESAYKNFNRFPATTVEKGYNRLTMMVQKHSEELSRVLLKPISETTTSSLPSPVTDKCLKWDSSGNLVNSTTDPDVTSDAAAASAAAALVSENNSATSETNAATSATNAATSETNAANSATASAASATSAATLLGVANKVTYAVTSITAAVIDSGSVFEGVDSGTLFTFTSNRTFDITGTPGDLGALDTGESEAADKWYYLIALGDTTAAVAPHIIGVRQSSYAAFSTSNLVGNYAAYDDFKRIGQAYNKADSEFRLGTYIDDWFYSNSVGTEVSTTSTSMTALSYVKDVPPVAREVMLRIWNSTTSTVAIEQTDRTTGSGHAVLGAASAKGDTEIRALLDSSQELNAKVSTGTVTTQIGAYKDDLTNEGQ